MADLQYALREQRQIPVIYADEAGPPEFDGAWVRVRYYRDGKLIGMTVWEAETFFATLERVAVAGGLADYVH